MTAYVQIAPDGVTVVSVFASPQDPAAYPGYVEVDDNDPRILVFNAVNNFKPTTGS